MSGGQPDWTGGVIYAAMHRLRAVKFILNVKWFRGVRIDSIQQLFLDHLTDCSSSELFWSSLSPGGVPPVIKVI